MKIGFYYQYTTPGSEMHLHIAKHLIASAKKHMPDVPVIQLTDEHSDTLYGVDEVRRIGGDLPMAVRRMTHHASLDGDWLFVDTDVVIQQDVSDVFKEAFDVALTDRMGTDLEGTPYAVAMPFNMGVTFSRCPKFWEEAKTRLKALHHDLQVWEGDQYVVCRMANECLHGNGDYRVKVLPGRIYNYPPSKQDDYAHASIVHFKGRARKAHLKDAA